MLRFSRVRFLRFVNLGLRVEAWAEQLLLSLSASTAHGLDSIQSDARFLMFHYYLSFYISKFLRPFGSKRPEVERKVLASLR